MSQVPVLDHIRCGVLAHNMWGEHWIPHDSHRQVSHHDHSDVSRPDDSNDSDEDDDMMRVVIMMMYTCTHESN